MNEKYYAAYLNNEEQLKLSSSGGMAYAISEQIILSGGVVFGIRYSNDFFCAKYVKIDNLENLSLLNGSKYITTEKVIDGVGVFKSVYNVLLNQRKVLFIGTPCDIGNLISFLKKNKCQDFDKLVTLDFICQGPIKAKVQKEYIQFLEHKYHSTLVDFSVRYKHPYWKPVYLRAVFSNGKEHIKPLYSTDFGRAFRIYGTERCYKCKYKDANHCSDITLGDFWGLLPEDKGYNRYGTSVLVTHTDKGEKVLNRLSNVMIFEYDKEKAVGNNPMYYESRKRNEKFYKFEKIYSYKGLHKAVFCTRNFPSKIKYLLNLFLGKRPY